MQFKNIYFRGKLKSCNYACSYCPFAKGKFSQSELDTDIRLLDDFKSFAAEQGNNVKIMLLPYGEGLIHKTYRQKYMAMAMLPNVVGVSCQTNLSFSVDEFLNEAEQNSVNLSKLKLWASFHPQAVSFIDFAEKANKLHRAGVGICVGSVGNPADYNYIKFLRESIDYDIYMFVNSMQGLKRKLTPVETKRFSEIDNLFAYDVQNTPANFANCKGGKVNVFVDEHKKLYSCLRSNVCFGKINDIIEEPNCNKKVCDCYIAYSNVGDFKYTKHMGDGAIWRIPDKRKILTAFFDIDGTLTNDYDDTIPESYVKALTLMSKKMPLYLATALPLKYAKHKLKNFFDIFSGGVFADGANTICKGNNEYVICNEVETYNCETKHYKHNNQPYKYALLKPDDYTRKNITDKYNSSHNIRCEAGLITLVDKTADKASGMLKICATLGISPKDVLAVGNTMNDWGMMQKAGYSCAVLTADDDLKKKSQFILNPDRLPAFFMY